MGWNSPCTSPFLPTIGRKKAARSPSNSPNDSEAGRNRLLNRTGDGGEYVIRVRANQTDRADYDYKDHREHHSVLCDVLTAIVSEDVQQATHLGITSFRLDLPERLGGKVSLLPAGGACQFI